MRPVILDTNVFVGAEFNRQSASARILRAVRTGVVALIWDVATKRETQAVLTRIPPVSWDAIADLFAEQHRWNAATNLTEVEFVLDPQDRKFAALSLAAEVQLVSSDSDLLDHRARLQVCTPSEFMAQIEAAER